MSDTGRPTAVCRSFAPRLALALLAVYLGAHLTLRLLVSHSVDVDESDIVLFSQSFEWGYHEQPPLYSWGIWILSQVLGISIFTITLYRLLILGSIHVLLYLCTRRATRNENAALLAACAPLAVPTFAWNAVAYLTHTLLACALSAAFCHALLRLRDDDRMRNYLVLGLVAGLGALTKYNFFLVALGLFAAALTQPSFRARLLDRRIILSLLVCGVVVLPHAIWLLRHWDAVHDGIAIKTQATDLGNLRGVVRGLGSLSTNVVVVMLPLLPFFLVCFPRALRSTTTDNQTQRLFSCYFIVAGVLLITQVAVGGVTQFHERWLQPVLILVPTFLFTRAGLVTQSERGTRWFAAGMAICAVGLAGVHASQIWLGGQDRGTYPLQMALSAPAAELRSAGCEHALIIAHDREIAGNLRLLFPEAQVLCSAQPNYRPRLVRDNVPLFLIWNSQMGHGPLGAAPPGTLERFVSQALRLRLAPNPSAMLIEIPPEKPGRRVNQLVVVRLAETGELAWQR
jgi:4-amino-4-deoxy-L-arabinose transferase-like glycosyltransferase